MEGVFLDLTNPEDPKIISAKEYIEIELRDLDVKQGTWIEVESISGPNYVGIFRGWSKKGNLRLEVNGQIKRCKPDRIRSVSIPKSADVLEFPPKSN